MKFIVWDEINKYTINKRQLMWSVRAMDKGKKRIESVSANNFGWRTMLMVFAVVIVTLSFLAKSISLQLQNNSKYHALAQNNKTRDSIILAERGVIYSHKNDVLVRNEPSFALELNKTLCADLCNRVVQSLSSYVKLDDQTVLELMSSERSDIILSKGIDKDTALLIEANLFQLPGISVIVYPKRSIVNPLVFSHSLGYVGLDENSLVPNIVGKSGVEEFYNTDLSGISGRVTSEVDSTGQKYHILSKQDALPGRDVVTYLDKELSEKAYDLLKNKVEAKEATAGAVVIQDPETGGILALVSYPAYDANKMSGGITSSEYMQLINDPTKPFYNRAISAVYPPGSTFKMITASAALTDGVVDETTSIFDPGYLIVNGFRFNNWRLDGHGDVNMVRALQVSNDTYFYTVGGGYGDIRGVGIDSLYKWATRFNYGTPTGIDVSGESAGYMPNGKQGEWYLGNTYITSIGQGDVLATPLQVNVVTTYFANGGKLLKPQIVKSIKGVKNFEPKIITQGLISKKNYDIITAGMHAAVTPGGTAYPFFDFPQKHNGIETAGKTGTSEFIGPDGKPATHAWFTIFAPYNTSQHQSNVKPISVTVFLEGGGAGSDDAAPIARELLDTWYK